VGDQQRGGPTEHGEEQALRQEKRDESAATDAEREADGHLAPTLHGAEE
jgi:hypothetical protein